MQITTTLTPTPPTTGRTFSADQLLQQIGGAIVLAISGGRIIRDTTGLILPVRQGYTVEVYLADDDTYTVRRVFTRAGKRFVKGERTGVYADQVSDAAYRASCYHDKF